MITDYLSSYGFARDNRCQLDATDLSDILQVVPNIGNGGAFHTPLLLTLIHSSQIVKYRRILIMSAFSLFSLLRIEMSLRLSKKEVGNIPENFWYHTC